MVLIKTRSTGLLLFLSKRNENQFKKKRLPKRKIDLEFMKQHNLLSEEFIK